MLPVTLLAIVGPRAPNPSLGTLLQSSKLNPASSVNWHPKAAPTQGRDVGFSFGYSMPEFLDVPLAVLNRPAQSQPLIVTGTSWPWLTAAPRKYVALGVALVGLERVTMEESGGGPFHCSVSSDGADEQSGLSTPTRSPS